MPQALPAPSAASPVTVCAAPQPAETADSGQSFSDALSNELGSGNAPATPVTKDPAPAPAASTGPDKAGETATVATAGNSLPPALPPEAMLTLSMLVPGTTPTQYAPAVPAGSTEHAAVPRAGSATPASGDAAPAIMPAVALPAASFALPLTAQTDATTGNVATTATTPTAPAAKPAVLVAHVAATLDTRTMPAISAPVSPDVDSSAAAIKAGNEQLSAVTDSLKAVVTPARAESVVEMPVLAAPAHAGAEALAALTNTANATGTANAAPTATISVPFGQPAWGQAFSNQVVWAANQGLPAAALHLSPPELGPVSVHIRLDQDQASIAFSSPHVAVRDAIEAAMPRLRDMLGNQGIVLVDVNVSQHGSSQAQAQAQDYSPGSGRAASETGEDGVVMTSPVRQAALGVLDLYA